MQVLFALSMMFVAQTTPSDAPAATTVMEAKKSSAAEILSARIAQAKTLLADAKIGTTRLGGQYAVLAVWNPAAPDDILLVRVQGAISRTPGFAVKLIERNGVNTLYEVTEPVGYVVLAIKTNVMSGRHATVVRRKHGRSYVRYSSGRTQEAIYVPYSDALKQPEIVAAGRQYLIDLTDRAAERLDGLEVKSLQDPELLVSETVPERVLITLLVIEHTDPGDFDRRGAKYMAEMILTMLAVNRADAFAYSFSPAGAGGLAQFINPTYRLTRARYPAAQLLPDFVTGMRDHVNAVMAQYCLADWSLAKLPPDKVRELSEGLNEEELGAYLAAAYNGGESRAAEAMLKHPDDWEKLGHGLYPETVTYVREFHAMYQYLFGAAAEQEPLRPPFLP